MPGGPPELAPPVPFVPETLPGLEPEVDPGFVPFVEPLPDAGGEFDPGFVPGFAPGVLVPPGPVEAPGPSTLSASSRRPSGGSIGPVQAATTPIRGVMNRQSCRLMETRCSRPRRSASTRNAKPDGGNGLCAALQAGDRVPVRSDLYSRSSAGRIRNFGLVSRSPADFRCYSCRIPECLPPGTVDQARRTGAVAQQVKRSEPPDQPAE